MLPCRSSSVCSLTAALRRRNRAQGNNARHRSMVVESRAYRLCSRSRYFVLRRLKTLAKDCQAVMKCGKVFVLRLAFYTLFYVFIYLRFLQPLSNIPSKQFAVWNTLHFYKVLRCQWSDCHLEVFADRIIHYRHP